jgi:hypothetical protein
VKADPDTTSGDGASQLLNFEETVGDKGSDFDECDSEAPSDETRANGDGNSVDS